jgi:hypothetical protein
MSNTFWAVFFGSSLGLFSVNIITASVDEYRRKMHKRDIETLLDKLEDVEFEDIED